MAVFCFSPKGTGYIFCVEASSEAAGIVLIDAHLLAKVDEYDLGKFFEMRDVGGWGTDYYVVVELSSGAVFDFPIRSLSTCCGS